MRQLSEKEHGELRFWINYVHGLGCELESGRSYVEQWSAGMKSRIAAFRRHLPDLDEKLNGVWADIGCGPYPTLLHAPDTVRALCIDPLMRHYFHHQLVPSGPEYPDCVFIESPIEDLPIPDETVDVAVCMNALDHVADPWRGLQEMTRILKIGGYLVVEVDTGGIPDFMHPHAFSAEELERRAEQAGLSFVHGAGITSERRRPGAELYCGYFVRSSRRPDLFQPPAEPTLDIMQPVLVQEGVNGFNIVRVGNPARIGRFYALHQDEGPFFYPRVVAGGYKRCYEAVSLEDAVRAARGA